MRFHDVCALGDLMVDSATKYVIDGHEIALVRIGDGVYAIGDRCSHADFSLSEGELNCGQKTLECWRHGSEFSLETGKPVSLPATKSVPVYDVVIEDGRVKVFRTSARSAW